MKTHTDVKEIATKGKRSRVTGEKGSGGKRKGGAHQKTPYQEEIQPVGGKERGKGN